MKRSKTSLALALILLVSGYLLSAQTQGSNRDESAKAAPNNPVPSKREKQQEKPTAERQTANSNPLPPWKPSEVISNTASNPHQEAPRDNTQATQNDSFWPSKGSWPDWLLVVVGLCTVVAAFKTLGIIADQAAAGRKAAEAALEEARAITMSERAYIKFSHMPPGVIFSGEYAEIQMRIKNFGRTPGRLQRVAFDVRYFDDPAAIPLEPPIIPLEHTHVCLAFLVPGDEIFSPRQREVDMQIIDKLRNGDGKLLIWGHVDYLDQFDRRHRCGYGRTYDHEQDDKIKYVAKPDGKREYEARNNLGIAVDRGYNYDRERRPDEG